MNETMEDSLRRSGVTRIMTKIVELILFGCMGMSVSNKSPRTLYNIRNSISYYCITG